jgi:hypothetical protein
VCRGTGWVTAAEYPAAESELIVQQSAVDNALDVATGQRVAPSRYSIRSRLGSVARLAAGRPYDLLRRLQAALFAYQEALDRRMSAAAESHGDDDDVVASLDEDGAILWDGQIGAPPPPRFATKKAATKAGR